MNLKSSGTQNYTDPNNVNWFVSSVPFFQTSDGNAFILLAFSKQALALEPLESLKHNIDDTTYDVTIRTSSIFIGLIGFEVILIVLLVYYLVRPLDHMRSISAAIVRISALEEENRNYNEVIEDFSI